MSARFAKFAPLGAIAAAAFIAAAPQSADALQFTYKGAEAGFSTVTYNRIDESKSETVNAGAFDFEDATSGGLGDFVAWCFDLDTTISNGTYTYTEASDLLTSDPPYFNPMGFDDAQTRVQKLFDKYYDPGTVLANSTNSAGFQLAVWEVLYDTDFDLDTGNFTGSGNTGVNNAAAGYLQGLDTFAGPQKWVLTTYDSTTKQDVGVASAIPLPAAAWLLLGVSGALIGAKRRSARKEA